MDAKRGTSFTLYLDPSSFPSSRSMLYKGADVIRDIEWVIFDEVRRRRGAHHLGSPCLTK